MDPFTIMAIAGAVTDGFSSIMGGFTEKTTAQENAAAFRAQAQNIGIQQGITAKQYATQGNIMQGQAVTTAARQGVKVSGTVANSISRSLTALNLDKGYQIYNLEVEKVKAINNARYQDYVADTAIARGFLGAMGSFGSALGKVGQSKYFENQAAGATNTNKMKLSGGFNFSNKAMVAGNQPIV